MLCETIVRADRIAGTMSGSLNTALIEFSPYRDLSLEAKKRAATNE